METNHTNTHFQTTLGDVNLQSQMKLGQIIPQKQEKLAEEKTLVYRQKQHILFYVFLVIAILFSGFQHLIFFFTNTGYGFVIAHTVYILRGVLWIACILNLLNFNWKEILRFSFLVDGLLLFQLMTICVCVFMFIIYQNYAYYTITFVITVTIVTHLNTTNFRVLMAHVFWSKWQIIIYKLAYIVVCLFYLSLGSYLITTKAMITNDSQKNDLINQYIILYVGANVTYFSELYSKITDYDGTGQLKFNYQLLNQQDSKPQPSIAQKEQKNAQRGINHNFPPEITAHLSNIQNIKNNKQERKLEREQYYLRAHHKK